MDFNRLKDFIAVATHLHFGRAAQERDLDQAGLSRSIRRLEEDLGATLFERSSRRVTLTEAGAHFLIDARRLVLDAQRASQQLRQIAAGEHRPLRVGFAGPVALDRLPQAVRRLEKHHPRTQLLLRELHLDTGPDMLRHGELDLCLMVRNVGDRDRLLDDWTVRILRRQRFVLALPSDWPLARRQQLSLRDLADVPLILPPRQYAPRVIDAIEQACAGVGFAPTLAHEIWQAVSMLSFVAGGLGAALVPEACRAMAMSGVSFLSLPDLPASLDMEVLAVYSPRMLTPAMRTLLDAMGPAG